MKRLELILFLGLILAIAGSNLKSFNESYENLQHNVLRLHILANSDSQSDQELKLKIRDELLERSSGWFNECKCIESAKDIVSERLPEINAIAESVIANEGYSYDVSSSLVSMDFDDREYNDITMPHGNYSAVRVEIGHSEGKNWWCVMYPPLCLPAAETNIDYNEFFSEGEVDILENCEKYEIKFKCVEIYNEIKETLAQKHPSSTAE